MKTIHKHLAITIVTAFCASTLQVKAQNPDRLQPTWWFGVSGAANFAFYQGSVRDLGNTLMLHILSRMVAWRLLLMFQYLQNTGLILYGV